MMAEGCAEFERHCTASLTFGTAERSLDPQTFTHFGTGKILGPSTRHALTISFDELVFGNQIYHTTPGQVHRRMRRFDRDGIHRMFHVLVGSRVEQLHLTVEVTGAPNFQHWIHLESLREARALGTQLKRLDIEISESIRGDFARSTFDADLENQVEAIGEGLAGMVLTMSKEAGMRSMEGTEYADMGQTWHFVFTRT